MLKIKKERHNPHLFAEEGKASRKLHLNSIQRRPYSINILYIWHEQQAKKNIDFNIFILSLALNGLRHNLALKMSSDQECVYLKESLNIVYILTSRDYYRIEVAARVIRNF